MSSKYATSDHANQDTNKQRSHRRKGHNKHYEFRGKIEDMNGHTFTSHGETSSPSQYSNTMEQLGRYVSHTYTYGEDIQSLAQNLKDTKISKPEDINQKTGNATAKRIWEKEMDEYVKRSGIYKSNTKKLYSVVWGQCSPVLQARMEQLPSYNTMHQDNDSIMLLKEMRASVFDFDNQAYLHNSMLKAKEALVRIRHQEHESNNNYCKRFK